MDKIIEVIDSNKDFIGDSTIIYVGENTDFFENIISILTNTVIFSYKRSNISSNFVTSTVVLFFESNINHSILEYIQTKDHWIKTCSVFKFLDTNNNKEEIENIYFQSNIVASSDDGLVFKEKPILVLNESFDEQILYEPEKLLFYLNKVF